MDAEFTCGSIQGWAIEIADGWTLDRISHGAALAKIYEVLGRNKVAAQGPLQISSGLFGDIVIRLTGKEPPNEDVRNKVIKELRDFDIPH